MVVAGIQFKARYSRQTRVAFPLKKVFGALPLKYFPDNVV